MAICTGDEAGGVMLFLYECCDRGRHSGQTAENFMKPIWIMSKVKADAVWITKLSRKCLIMITFSV